MLTKDSFILLPCGTTLTGALCRIGLKSRNVLWLHSVPCGDPQNVSAEAGVRALLDGLAAANLPLPEDVRLCLSAENALFRDWAFPFSSPGKVRQALGLLLESEFPFEPSLLEHRIHLAGTAPGSRKGVQAISVSLFRDEIGLWLDALAAAKLFPRLVTSDPFPLLHGLPKALKGTALLLHVHDRCTVAALLEGGIVRRVRTLPEGWTPGDGTSEAGEAALSALAGRLRHACALMLEGTTFTPESLLLYGEPFLRDRAAARFAEAFELPARTLGQDMPLAGQLARLGEDDPSRLLALCVAALPTPGTWRQSVPSFHRPRAAAFSGTRARWALRAAGCFALAGAAFLCSVGAEGYAHRRDALRYETASRELFRKALPDARASVNPVQMESILKSRIAALSGGDAQEASFPGLGLLEAMHTAVPASLAVHVDRLSLDARRCGLSGTAATYEQVNALRDALAAVPGVREAKILSAANRTGRPDPNRPTGAVIFEMEMVLGGRP